MKQSKPLEASSWHRQVSTGVSWHMHAGGGCRWKLPRSQMTSARVFAELRLSQDPGTSTHVHA